MLTLALGIGGTTAIFTLIHAVMLKSLPVADPSRLYRIGDGDNCCVQGGPQDRWGFFSFPLFQQLAAQSPEFEQVTAFQAGGSRLSVRREQVETVARPLRTEYVTGNYFSTLGVGAFGGRVLTVDDDQASATPVAVMSHHTWTTTYGIATRRWSARRSCYRGIRSPSSASRRPGFFGETLRGDPPDLWLPLQQEPLLAGAGVTPAPADLGVAARDRTAASRRHGRRRWGRA